MWTYKQSTGALTDKDGKVVAHGYSGKGEGRNNPSLEHVRGVGPIPAGEWRITGKPYNSAKVGPYALILEPVGHKAHGRSAFRIHGNNKANDASNGCIILGPAVRRAMYVGGDHSIMVVP